MNKPLMASLCMLGQLTLLSACNGIMEGLYDVPPPSEGQRYGFIHHDTETGRGRLLLDVVSYKHWTFIDLHHQRTHTLPIPDTLTGAWDGRSGMSYMQVTWPSTFVRTSLHKTDAMPTPTVWDFALHHYDVRSHQGEALETEFSTLDELLQKGNRDVLLAKPFVGDVWSDHWAYQDLRGIYDFHIGYHNTEYNPMLSRWMDMRVQNPPPSYHMSGRVYLLRMKDGSVAALDFVDYMSASGAKGYVSIEYIYPY